MLARLRFSFNQSDSDWVIDDQLQGDFKLSIWNPVLEHSVTYTTNKYAGKSIKYKTSEIELTTGNPVWTEFKF